MSELWPINCVLCLFCIIYILVHPITHSCNAIGHSEFSQGDVSGTRMNVPPFFRNDAPTVLEKGRVLRRWQSSCL